MGGRLGHLEKRLQGMGCGERQRPGLSPKSLTIGKLMEIFVLREVLVNKGFRKPSALPLGKFIHNSTVCYFN